MMHQQNKPVFYVLDVGAKAQSPFESGRILVFGSSGVQMRILVRHQSMPDGIGVSAKKQRLYWSNMGTPGNMDGSIFSCDLEGNDMNEIVPKGGIHTPKQLFVDDKNEKIYFADREGLRVMCCKMDGSDLETLVQAGDYQNEGHRADPTRWCVGVAVSPKMGKIFWSQKGESRGSHGRILCMDINPKVKGESQREVKTLLQGLPEPIDLYFDDQNLSLYWTDRGELPFGKSLNGLSFPSLGSKVGDQAQHRILARNFHDPIGLVVDSVERCAYVADLGGSIYKCDLLHGGKERIYQDEDSALTGIARCHL